MTTKKYCDRCLGEYEIGGIKIEITGKNIDGYRETIYVDLCPDCIDGYRLITNEYMHKVISPIHTIWGDMTYECSHCGEQHSEAISCPWKRSRDK